MSQEIEIEYKNLLTRAEFDRLLASLPFPDEPRTQTNHYFETADFSLKKRGCALRIREKNGSYTLTLKEPHSTGLLETHDVLSETEAMNWTRGNGTVKEHTGRRLENMGISVEDLIYHGSLKTMRRELSYQDVLLVLDTSIYHGQHDYELELEAQSEETGRRTMENLIDAYHIEKRDTPNKIQRFFTAKSEKDRHGESD